MLIEGTLIVVNMYLFHIFFGAVTCVILSINFYKALMKMHVCALAAAFTQDLIFRLEK